MAPDSSRRSTYEITLVERLRTEANDVKECFTRFSFQAIALSGVVIGVIAGYQINEPVIGLVSIAVIVVLVSVARIGTYKYATANRHYGYELHLDRTREIPDDPEGGWNASMRSIGWEEAMKAWRVVQATVFRELYGTNKNTLKKGHQKSVDAAPRCGWFEPQTLTYEGKGEYHPGSYLKTMFKFLNLLTALAFAPLFALGLQLLLDPILPDPRITILADVPWEIRLLGFLPFVVVLGFTLSAMYMRRQRRELLELGLLSIHSCAIMWQAVVVAHYRALAQLKNRPRGEGAGYRGYMYYLSEEASDLATHVFYIQDWIRAGGVAETDRLRLLMGRTVRKHPGLRLATLRKLFPGRNRSADRWRVKQLVTGLRGPRELVLWTPQESEPPGELKLPAAIAEFDETPVWWQQRNRRRARTSPRTERRVADRRIKDRGRGSRYGVFEQSLPRCSRV